MVEFKINE